MACLSPRGILGVALAAALAACASEERSNPLRQLLAEAPEPPREVQAPLAFRLPSDGGEARLFDLPGLSERGWSFDWGPHATARAVGHDASEKVVYALTTGRELVELDLETGRTHVLDSNVVMAVLDAADRTIVVHDDGTIGNVEQRTLLRWADSLPARPDGIWGGARGRIVADVRTEETRELWILQSGASPIRKVLPTGPLAVGRWGDVAAVATDSGLVTLVTEDSATAAFLPLTPAPRLLAFSPAGHEIYVVLGDGIVTTVDRFDLIESRRITLPGRVTALRVDPKGRRLVIGREADDSLWIMELGRGRRVTTVEGTWATDLPAIASDGSVLVRRGKTVAVLTPPDFQQVGETGEPTEDRWVVADWEARQPAHLLASARGADVRPTGQVFYVQVSSSRNPAWAEDFAQKLRAAGMDALVLNPEVIDELYHVVLGPYTTRQEAESVGRRVGLPFWIVSRVAELPSR